MNKRLLVLFLLPFLLPIALPAQQGSPPIGPAPATGGCSTSDSNALQKSNGSGGCAASAITDNGTTTTVTDLLAASANAAASTPSFLISGTPFGSGNGTTNVPQVYINQTGNSAPSTWASAGRTLIGGNAPSGFSGTDNFLDFHVNGGAALFHVDGAGTGSMAGNLTLGGSSALLIGTNAKYMAPASGVALITNNGGTGLTRLDLGLNTTSGPALSVSTTAINVTLGDGTTGGTLTAGNLPAMQSCGTTSTCGHTAIATTARIVYGGNNLLKVVNASSSSITITGPNTTTDTINYICVGN
jgi:hypothetical protein